jgi:threonine/homoserine/homoserine lactone efflux protein
MYKRIATNKTRRELAAQSNEESMAKNSPSIKRIVMASVLVSLLAPLLFFFCLSIFDAFSSNSLATNGVGSLVFALITGLPIACANMAFIVSSVWLVAGREALSKTLLLGVAGTFSGAFTILVMGGLTVAAMVYGFIAMGGFVGCVSAVVFSVIVRDRPI